MLNALLLTIFAGLSTLIGGLIVFFIKKTKDSYLSIAMGFSAGVMIFVSFVELLPQSINSIGYLPAIISFFVGLIVIYLIDVFIPHSYEAECVEDSDRKKINLKRCGVFLAIGIAIHNFPEGIAVFYSSLTDLKLGLAIALAITLHNIPEGMAVAMPIYYATGSKIKAFWYSFWAGMAEPIGALLTLLFLYRFINNTILNIILALVAGLMIFISFDELLPKAYDQKNTHPIILGIFLGMVVMALSLFWLR